MNGFSLDAKAGEHFAFRDFIECGKTWQRVRIDDPAFDNRPKRDESWVAIRQLATVVLDPIWNHHGRISLTYGFCSPPLARQILKQPTPNISPANDQHASCELNTLGNIVCARLGAACDFSVLGKEGHMKEIALWIASNLEFDRMYYYGNDRPLHISWGPTEMNRMVVLMHTDTAKKNVRRPRGRGSNEKGVELLKSVTY